MSETKQRVKTVKKLTKKQLDSVKGLLPFDSTAKDRFKLPELAELGVYFDLRPMTLGEKKDARRLSTEIAQFGAQNNLLTAKAIETGEPCNKLLDYTEEIERQWNIVFGCIEGSQYYFSDGTVMEMTLENWENHVPDRVKNALETRALTISGLTSYELAVLG